MDVKICLMWLETAVAPTSWYAPTLNRMCVVALQPDNCIHQIKTCKLLMVDNACILSLFKANSFCSENKSTSLNTDSAVLGAMNTYYRPRNAEKPLSPCSTSKCYQCTLTKLQKVSHPTDTISANPEHLAKSDMDMQRT